MAKTDYELLYETTLSAKHDLDAQHQLLGEEVKRLKSSISTLRNALRTAYDHIDIASLEISHCKDAEIIRAALAATV